MTAKVRIEFVLLAAPGQDGGEAVNQEGGLYLVDTMTITGGPVNSVAAPQFGTDRYGAAVLSGAAKIIALSGAVNVNWLGAVASETNAARVEPTSPIIVPIATGAFLSLIEALDGPDEVSTGATQVAGAVTVSNDVTTSDTNSAAFGGEIPMTVGEAAIAPQRSLKVMCSAAGNVEVMYPDGSTGIWAVVLGTQVLPLAVTQIVAAGTTATATYANLK